MGKLYSTLLGPIVLTAGFMVVVPHATNTVTDALTAVNGANVGSVSHVQSATAYDPYTAPVTGRFH